MSYSEILSTLYYSSLSQLPPPPHPPPQCFSVLFILFLVCTSTICLLYFFSSSSSLHTVLGPTRNRFPVSPHPALLHLSNFLSVSAFEFKTSHAGGESLKLFNSCKKNKKTTVTKKKESVRNIINHHMWLKQWTQRVVYWFPPSLSTSKCASHFNYLK